MSGIGRIGVSLIHAYPVGHIDFWRTVKPAARASKSARVILCIEDQASPLAMRKMLLEKSGYIVLSATSGKEALIALQEFHVDLVLSDHYLKSELGTAVAAQIKGLKPKIPVLLISGSADTLVSPAGAENVDEVISKTAGPTNLLVSIARSLQL